MTARSGASRMLALGALGVVFGDIGTSPLYAFQQCFTGDYPAALTPDNVFGICSLIVWAILIVVCIKYLTFMLRADFDGQGGTLALLAQLIPRKPNTKYGLSALTLMVLFGSAMLYGDGAITPAISVISAIEGLDVWTLAAHPYIVPISIIVLIGLFAVQRRGTGSIGRLFGPIMLLWFFAIGAAGIAAIVHTPEILRAISPSYALAFVAHNGLRSFLVFGAVVLCVTGVEALYADLAHFGRKPIMLAWYVIVLPALLVNYLGQGALTLRDPHSINSSFYTMFPHWAILPMVLLATAATIIASQALISGVFSLTQQAMQLGYTPRFRIIHTSRHYAGQIYMPTINMLLAVVCIALVLAFRSSLALGGAYGLAVTITMITTTISFAALLQRNWRWPLWQWVPLISLFLLWDIPFLIGNLWKILSGGWVPVVLALTLFTMFVIWNRGRRRLMEVLSSYAMPTDQFLKEAKEHTSLSGTAVFLTPDTKGIPFALHHQWLRSHILYETIVLLTVVNTPRPFVNSLDRIDVEKLAPQLLRVRAHYGFMQEAKIADILHHLRKRVSDVDLSHPTYYLARPKISQKAEGGLPSWQVSLFRIMSRTARPLTDSLELPPDSVIEFGAEARI
ncbi:MAG: KUP/HAK/KT family potassium transporter [Candidatus Eremiobacteraeota bacterium]|nr:KUP/HAK/KT family potassium transporter [Candidatus Eremiobacteraeota bacterium]